MNENAVCPRCQKLMPSDAPGGLCPECLLGQAMGAWRDSKDISFPGLDQISLEQLPAVPEAPGRYTYITEHARGGMGRVLLVNDTHLNRDVALKELLPPKLANEAATPTPMRATGALLARFLQEAQITGQLEHPSIVPVYELGRREDGSLYYTMKLVRGRTLSQAIAEAGSLENRLKLLPHFLDLCQAIAYAHSRRVLHRDLKPMNVMVGEFGETVVLDWGLAKVKHREDKPASSAASTFHALKVDSDPDVLKSLQGQAVGTPAYMPPEQVRGLVDAVDERSDVYSLGAVLYELISARPPYEGKTGHEVLNKVLESAPEPVRRVTPAAPPELAAICERALQRDPSMRYQSAREFAEEISRFQTGALVNAYRYTASDRIARFLQRHKALMTTTGLAAVVLVLLSLGYLASLSKANQELRQSRDTETLARHAAESARQEAVIAQKEAETARQDAEVTVRKLEQTTYTQNIQLAKSNIELRDFSLARQQLEDRPSFLRHWEWGYLHKSLDSSISAFGQQAAEAYHTAMNHAGTRIVVGEKDKATLWDVQTGQRLFELKGNNHEISRFEFSTDNARILGLSDAWLIWDASSGELLKKISREGEAETPEVTTESQYFAFSPNGHQLATRVNGGVRIWDIESGTIAQLLQSNENLVAAAYSPDGAYLAVATWDGSLHLWDAHQGIQLKVLSDEVRWYVTLTFKDDSSLLMMSSEDHGMGQDNPKSITKIWSIPEGDLVGSITENVSQPAPNPDWTKIAALTPEHIATVFDATSGTTLFSLNVATDPVYGVYFSRSGEEVLTTTLDYRSTVWDAHSGEAIANLNGLVEFCGFDASGAAAISNESGILKRFPVSAVGTLAQLPESGASNPRRLGISEDGTRCLVRRGADTAAVVDAVTGEELATLSETGTLRHAQFDAHNGRVLTRMMDKANWPYSVWDVRSGEHLYTFTPADVSVYCTSFTPDGTGIITKLNAGIGDDAAPDMMLDAATGAVRYEFPKSAASSANVYFSKDGQKVALLSFNEPPASGEWRILDAATGKQLTMLDGAAGLNPKAFFDADGKLIAISTDGGYAGIWSAENGLSTLELPSSTSVLGFSPDGKRLLTTSGPNFGSGSHRMEILDGDNSCTLWDAFSGEKLLGLQSHSDAIICAAFTPDGKRIVTASESCILRVFNAESGEELLLLPGFNVQWSKLEFTQDGLNLLGTGTYKTQESLSSYYWWDRTGAWQATPWSTEK